MKQLIGNIPVTWDINYIQELSYNDVSYREKVTDYVVDKADLDRYGNNGWIVGVARDFDQTHFDDVLKKLPWVKDPLIQVNRVLPGITLPYHTDDVAYHRDKLINKNDVIRIIVFLEDWKSGQHFEVNFNNIETWKAGDWVAFKPTIPHLSVNSGHHNRYALQITGRLA